MSWPLPLLGVEGCSPVRPCTRHRAPLGMHLDCLAVTANPCQPQACLHTGTGVPMAGCTGGYAAPCTHMRRACTLADSACSSWSLCRVDPPRLGFLAASAHLRAMCRQLTFTFSTQTGNAVGVAFECALVRGGQGAAAPAFSACSSPAVFQGLADGAWQFRVRAVGEELADTAAFVLVGPCCQPPGAQAWTGSVRDPADPSGWLSLPQVDTPTRSCLPGGTLHASRSQPVWGPADPPRCLPAPELIC